LNICRLALAAVLLVDAGLLPEETGAHPHVFIESAVTVHFGNEGPAFLEIRWEFDELFSSTLLATFDNDHSGTFSLEESRRIERKDFAGLKYFQYFVDLSIDGHPVAEVTARDFLATAAQGRVRYGFTVPLAGAGATRGVITLNVVDPTLFYAVSHARTPVLVQAPPHFRAQCALRRDPQTNRPEGIRCEYHRQPP
jgi:ABC-type uncharacterized transport system substrate-binding protein